MGKKDEDTSAEDVALHQTLIGLAIHQDQLFWSTVQMLIAVQGAVLAASYAVHATWLGPAVLGLGAGLSLFLLFVSNKTERDRDANRPLIDALATRLVRRSFDKEARSRMNLEGPPFVRFSGPPNWATGGLRGGTVLRTFFVSMIVLDLVLAVILIADPSWFPLSVPAGT